MDIKMLLLLLMQAYEAMKWFVTRVEQGAVRSTRSYKRFKEVLQQIDGYLTEKIIPEPAWIGVDLDGTLAEYHGWQGPEHIGPPIPAMLERVKRILADGEMVDGRLVRRVKVFTARAAIPSQVPPIRQWLDEHGLKDVEITCIKNFSCVLILDDRCQQIVTNTGVPVKLQEVS